ncbi:MAG: hypothetical protein AAGA03_11785 [Planctomycetota bacterium]
MATCTAGTVTADWHDWLHRIRVGYHRNIAWPDPFNEADAIQAVAPFEVMKNNGWRLHNTIGHELFRKGDGALLAAGHNHLRWIATQAPANRKAVFVLIGKTNAETEARVASVRAALSSYEGVTTMPRVFITHREQPTTPGPWANKISRDRLENMPPPVLPSESASGIDGAAEEGDGETE